VFLDDRHQYSVRAYTYEDQSPPLSRGLVPYHLSSIRSYTAEDKSPVALPTLTVQQLLADLGPGLRFHQTTIDTAIIGGEVDKGSGLSALLELVGVPAEQTTAIGDSEPDLPMFRVAGRSFAPSQIGIGCARLARLLGCKVVRRPCQRGLLDIARALVHPGGGRCQRCVAAEVSWPQKQDLIVELLQAADRPRIIRLLRALFDPKAYKVFLR
jgi:hypothetical protein